jgi:SAM-dependent methyltransferase
MNPMNWINKISSLDISQEIMIGDHMYNPSNPKHYFGVGESGLRCIASAAIATNQGGFSSICDFASGSGRVTRYLRAAFPEAKIVCADLREDSLAWLERTFNCVPWHSDADFSGLHPPFLFDLVWSGSLITHLCAEDSRAVLRAVSRWLLPNGIGVVTTHGRKVVNNRLNGRVRYISDEAFAAAHADYQRSGFGYADYPGRKGVGFSICSPAWVVAELLQVEGIRIIGTFEHGWDNHQDVFVFQKTNDLLKS